MFFFIVIESCNHLFSDFSKLFFFFQNLYALFHVVTEVSALLSLWLDSDLTAISLKVGIQ